MKLTKFLAICLASIIFFANACKKESGNGNTKPEMADSLIEKNILEIAPSVKVFNEWVDTVLKYKLGISPDYAVQTFPDFSIQKINVTKIDSFKLAEILIKVDGSTFNCFIGTLFDFIEAPKLNKYALKPMTNIPTPARTLIFSSGTTGNTKLSYSASDSIFTITTNEKNLFFLGAFIHSSKSYTDLIK